IKTHSFLNAPLSSSRKLYPVIFFSHGLMGLRGQNTVQMEELASRGYIVVALDHTYDAAFTILADDRLVTFQTMTGPASPDAEPVEWENDLEVREQDLLSLYSCLEAYGKKMSDSSKKEQRLTIENCPRINELVAHLDLGRCGILGHSLGGTN